MLKPKSGAGKIETFFQYAGSLNTCLGQRHQTMGSAITLQLRELHIHYQAANFIISLNYFRSFEHF